MTEKDNSFNLKYATFSAKNLKWQVLTNFYMYTIGTKSYLNIRSNLKFIYSEKATKFCEIFTLLLTTVHTVKSKVKISQNVVAFSEYMN